MKLKNSIGAVALNADIFSEGNLARILTDIECVGNETRLFDCTWSMIETHTCVSSGVVCQCKLEFDYRMFGLIFSHFIF